MQLRCWGMGKPMSPGEKPQHFIRQWRKYRRLTQEQVADAIGSTPGSISQLENGKQGFTDSTLYALATALGTSPGELLSRAPPSVDGGVPMSVVPLMGYVGAGAEVEPDFEQVPDDGLEQVAVPLELPADMIAFQVKGDSMLPMFDDGMVIIVFREQRRATETFFGQRAIVRTVDGRRYIKTLMRGDGGSVNLLSWNARPIEHVEVAWIGEIFTFFPAEAIRREVRKVARQGGIQGQLKSA